jgi:cytochrome c biogenesis protein CcdA
MLEELFIAFMVGISFSNAFVCMLLGFGTTSVERRNTGKYFILGRFLGVIILGLIIALLGVMVTGYMTYLLILFGILTILFGLLIIYRIYSRIKAQKSNPEIISCSDTHLCSNCPSGSENHCNSNCGELNCDNECSIRSSRSNLTKSYSFALGLFRGATPCLKIFILVPLLIVVNLQLALLMIIVFAAASTVYPIIGFLSASILMNFRKYEVFVRTTGAFILISIGVFTIIKYLQTPACTAGV